PVRSLRQPRSDRRSHIYVAATHNVGLPQALRNRARKRRLPRHLCLAPEPCWKRYEPLVSDIRLWSKSILGYLGAFRSVLEGVLPRQRALSKPPQQRGKDARRAARSDGRRRRATRRISEPNPFWPPKLQAKRLWSTEFAGQRVTA